MSSPATLGGRPPRSSSRSADDQDLQAQLTNLRAELAALRDEETRLRNALTRSDETRQRQLGLLAGGMAHDFNNLLTIIAGYATLLNEDEQTSPGARERLGEILRASNCAKDLTQKLLILSRKQPRQPRVIEVDHFLRKEAVKPLEQLAGARVTVTPRLAARNACIRIDPGELMHVLTNLVLNARDAMPAGGALTIATSLEPFATYGKTKGTYVRVSVTDTGSGMDETGTGPPLRAVFLDQAARHRRRTRPCHRQNAGRTWRWVRRSSDGAEPWHDDDAVASCYGGRFTGD